MGARWTGHEHSESKLEDSQLDALAKKNVNTPGRRAAFVAIMSSSDAQDAAWRCNELVRLSTADEGDIATACLHCCGAEKAYNRFYADFLAVFVVGKKKANFALKLALWDSVNKLQASKTPEQWRVAANVGKLLGSCIASGAASFIAFKPIGIESVLSPDSVGTAVLLASALRSLMEVGDVEFETAAYRARADTAETRDARDALAAFVSRRLTPANNVADLPRFKRRKAKLHAALLGEDMAAADE